MAGARLIRRPTTGAGPMLPPIYPTIRAIRAGLQSPVRPGRRCPSLSLDRCRTVQLAWCMHRCPEHRAADRVLRSRSELARCAGELNALADAAGAPATTYFEAGGRLACSPPRGQPATVLVERDAGSVGVGLSGAGLAGAGLVGAGLVGVARLTLHRERAVWRVHKAGVGGEPFRLLALDPAAASELVAGIHAELVGLTGPWKLMLSDLPAEDRGLLEALAARLPSTSLDTELDTPVLRFEGSVSVN